MLTISAKLVGVGAVYRRWIVTARTIWITDADRGDGKRFVVRADEILTAFVELELAIRVANSKRRVNLVPGPDTWNSSG
jgi:hypothetical protein